MISVIVPIYNAAQYLEKCVNAILEQTYNEIEILLIDDGSSDNSGELCDEYEERKFCIHVIHTENGGAAHARNVGLDNAQGDYIVFVDADDVIPEDHLQVLAETQEKYDADMVVASVTYVPGPTVGCKECVCNTWEFIEKVLYRDGAADYPISKLYRREMFEGIRFKEGITSEDFELFYRLYKRAKIIAVTDATTYYYKQNPGSVSNGSFSEKFFNRIDICKNIIRELSNEKPELLLAAQALYVDEAIWLYGILPVSFKKEKNKLKSIVRSNAKKVLQNKKVVKNRKLRILIFLISPQLWVIRMKLKFLFIRAYRGSICFISSFVGAFGRKECP